MYGLIKDGLFVPAPHTQTDEKGMVHYHPSDAMYQAAGYLLQVDTDCPETKEGDATYYISHYVDDGKGRAMQTWEAVIPPEPEPEPEPETEPEPDPGPMLPSIEERLINCEDALLELAGIIGGV